MAIHTHCTCGQEIWAHDDFAGQLVHCPRCKQVLALPDLSSAAEPVLEEEESSEPFRQCEASEPILGDVMTISVQDDGAAEPILEDEPAEPILEDKQAPFAFHGEDAMLPAERIGLNDGLRRGRLRNALGFGAACGPVRSLALAPDCRFALAAVGPLLFQADLTTGRHYFQLPAHQADITAVAVSPDGRHAASADRAGHILLWDLATRRGLRWLTGHTNKVAALAFAPSAAFLASVGADASLRFWEVETGKELVRVWDDAPFTRLAYSRDGSHLLTGSRGGEVSLWDVRRAKLIQELESHFDEPVVTVAFSRDAGRAMAAARHGGGVALCSWERATGPSKLAYHRSIFLDEGHRGLAGVYARYDAPGRPDRFRGTVDRGQAVAFWPCGTASIASGQQNQEFDRFRIAVRRGQAVAFSPCGTHCLVTGAPHKEFDMHADAEHWTTPVFEVELSRGLTGLSFSFHSRFRKFVGPVPVPAAHSIILSHVGDRCLVGYDDGTVAFG